MSFFDDLKVLFTDQDPNEVETDEVKDINQERKKKSGGSFLKGLPIWIILLGLLLFYLSTGIYKVGPKEVGVVKRFGRYVRQTESGLNYHLPYPIEEVHTPRVTKMRRIEIGFRTIDPGPPARYEQKKDESLMLTGDLAIISADAVVKYKIKDPIQYLFWINKPNATVRDASEAALREVVGKNKMNDVLTSKKTEIQLEAQELLQNLLDEYQSGIHIDNFLFQDVAVPEPVQGAYRDVASAKEDKQKKINEAEAYRNQIIPEAKGKASQIINKAQAYQAERTAEAEGDVARFNELLKRYEKGEQVTRTRLYLETMEKILPSVDKVIVGKETDGLLKMLNVDKLEGGSK
ncbi:MAG: FtsH protease activity modulator HflK [Bacillota bacterium]